MYLSPLIEIPLGFGGAWGGMLAFDTLIFLMTVFKSLVHQLETRGSSILALMLRDGEPRIALLYA